MIDALDLFIYSLEDLEVHSAQQVTTPSISLTSYKRRQWCHDNGAQGHSVYYVLEITLTPFQILV